MADNQRIKSNFYLVSTVFRTIFAQQYRTFRSVISNYNKNN